MCDNNILIPSLLLPPAKFYSNLFCFDNIYIDTNETFPKQTLRNRYYIGAPNGVQTLTIPIKKNKGHKTKTNQIEIDYSTDWIGQHTKSLITAYSKSAYFLYFKDLFFEEFEKKHNLLVSLNAALHSLIEKCAGLKYPKFIIVENYIKTFDGVDIRQECKNTDKQKLRLPYFQQFDNRFGFRNDLSILDILFNLGNETIIHLKKENANL